MNTARENTATSSFRAGDTVATAACMHAELLLAVDFVLHGHLLDVDVVEAGVVVAQADSQLGGVGGLEGPHAQHSDVVACDPGALHLELLLLSSVHRPSGQPESQAGR